MVLTPAGAGAVAVIEVHLSSAQDESRAFAPFMTSSTQELTDLAIGRILYGTWNGEDVVLVRTDLQRWEVHCHGGSAAIARILHDLNSAGIKTCSADEFLAKSDPDQIAVNVLQTAQQCRTLKTAGLALAQLDGRLHHLMVKLRSADESDRFEAEQYINAWRNVAAHLTTPWKVAIVGSPNVGKSSLLNAIAGRERSIVSSTAGTTRDLVEADIILDGWMFRLTDTAGVRDAADSGLERIGIEHSLKTLEDSDLVCIVVEALSPEIDSSLLPSLQNLTCPVCIVENKSDLLKQDASFSTDSAAFAQILPKSPRIKVSALTGSGLPQLLDWILNAAIPCQPTSKTALPLPGLF
jgi:tRNA modification GTPase